MSKNKNSQRVVFLSEGDISQPSAAHRIYPLADYLRGHGIEAEVVAGVRRKLGRSRVWVVSPVALLRAYRLLNTGDVLVVHRTSHCGVYLLVRIARLRKRVRVVFDFDDSIFLKKIWRFMNPLYSAIEGILEQSSQVWCGSHALVEFASPFTECQLLPTAVAQEFLAASSSGTAPPTILWIGNGLGQLDNLSLLVEPLTKLARVVKFRLHIASSLGSTEIRTVFRPVEELVEIDYGWNNWLTLEGVVNKVRHADIGLMPLVDTDWNRGKCAMKALETMALGLPTLMSNVGENQYVADEGRAALLASDNREWYRHLRRLVSSAKLRKMFGDAGFERVNQLYTPDVVFSQALASLRLLDRFGLQGDRSE